MMRMNPYPATINSLLTQNSPYPNPPLPTRTVAFTTPENYATRLSLLIHRRNWNPLWCPSVIVEPTAATHNILIRHLARLDDFSAIAFTSRSGISAFASALSATSSPPLSGEDFIVSALGKDAELLTREFLSRLNPNSDRVRVLVPPNATPSGLVESLGPGLDRNILCPVPLVVGLEEPPVVPDFLNELSSMGWVPVRAEAYETRWAGPKCAEKLAKTEHVDGVVFTSTAEVEGLLKGLREIGLDWEEMMKRWPKLVVAAHGPVTASGAERLGVRVDVVSSKFSSFDGVVEALAHTLGKWEYH